MDEQVTSEETIKLEELKAPTMHLLKSMEVLPLTCMGARSGPKWGLREGESADSDGSYI